MVQNEKKNSLFKKVLAAIKPVDQTLNNIQNTATPVWTNLDKLIDLYMGDDFRAIAEDRIHYIDDSISFCGYEGDFGYVSEYNINGKVEDAYEQAIQKEIEWLMDYEGKEKNQ